MENLWQVGEKNLSTLVTKPMANMGEQSLLSESVFKKSITFLIFSYIRRVQIILTGIKKTQPKTH